MDALIIKKKWLDLILAGKKTWEIRGTRTKVRGKIALIESGSGLIMGHAEIVDVVGPLSRRDLLVNAEKHQAAAVAIRRLRYDRPHAWVLKNAKRYRRPKAYHHPQGAVIWVKDVA